MSLQEAVAAAITDASGLPFRITAQTAVGGGDISESHRLDGADGRQYFLKLNEARYIGMLAAEADGLAAIAATQTIRVPQVIARGNAAGQAFLVLEHLELRGRGDERLLGEQLAAMHRCTSLSLPPCRGKDRIGIESPSFCISTPSLTLQQFGFAQANFIGTTHQPNIWNEDWIAFWREQRLGYQLQLAARNGHTWELQALGKRLLDALPAFFDGYTPQPSLLHGDLWGGNHGFLADGTPVIFDPAAYYGDRECDIAMTELFGGYGAGFYAAYRAAWPLDEGYAKRRELYNLYHMLNHANLFGGGYARQAEGMMRRLLAQPA